MKKVSLILIALLIAIFPYTNYHTNPTNDTVQALGKAPIKEQKTITKNDKNKEESKEKQPTAETSKKQSSKTQPVEKSIENKPLEKNETSQQTQIDPLTEIKNKNDSLGTAGRLYIPEVNINVGINHADFYDNENYNAQAIVDKEDSAAYFIFSNKTTIADHSHQGFIRIANLNNGAKAYIKKNNGTIEVYQLLNKFRGQNTTEDLIDSTGNSVQNMNGSLIMYTCYGLNSGVMITLWNRIS